MVRESHVTMYKASCDKCGHEAFAMASDEGKLEEAIKAEGFLVLEFEHANDGMDHPGTLRLIVCAACRVWIRSSV